MNLILTNPIFLLVASVCSLVGAVFVGYALITLLFSSVKEIHRLYFSAAEMIWLRKQLRFAKTMNEMDKIIIDQLKKDIQGYQFQLHDLHLNGPLVCGPINENDLPSAPRKR